MLAFEAGFCSSRKTQNSELKKFICLKQICTWENWRNKIILILKPSWERSSILFSKLTINWRNLDSFASSVWIGLRNRNNSFNWKNIKIQALFWTEPNTQNYKKVIWDEKKATSFRGLLCILLEILLELVCIHGVSPVPVQLALASFDHVDEEGQGVFLDNRNRLEVASHALKNKNKS